jgi:hypothetical protein
VEDVLRSAQRFHAVPGELVILAPAHSPSGSPGDGSLPSKQEEVVAAKRAPIGYQDKVQKRLDAIANADASELDRPAMWTVCGEYSHFSSIRQPERSDFAARPVVGAVLARNEGTELEP